MITIFFPGHPSHFEGKFTEAEIKEGLQFLTEHYPRPPFTRSKVVILREPGNLQTTSDDVQKEAPTTAAGRRSAGLLQSDVAYCEQWRVKRIKEMVDFMAKRREGGPEEKK